MIGRVAILIIGHLLIPLMRGMSICLLQSFPGSNNKSEQQRSTSFTGKGIIFMVTGVSLNFHSFISFEKMRERPIFHAVRTFLLYSIYLLSA